MPGEGGSSFLRVPPGARAAGTGGAFTAAAEEAQALFWNPAGLAPSRTPSFHSSHAFYFDQTRLDALSLSYPTLWGGLAAGTRWFTGPGMPKIRNGVPLGDFKAWERTAEFAAAAGKRSFSLGAAARLYQSRLDDEQTSALMFDAGVLKTWKKGRWRLGAAAQNLGPSYGFGTSAEGDGPPPRLWRAGLALRTAGRLQVSADYEDPLAFPGLTRLGLEWGAGLPLTLRTGYTWSPRPERDLQGPLAAWSGGMGFRAGPVEVDYAYAPDRLLGELHQVSLGFRFTRLTELEQAGRLSLEAKPAFFSPNGDGRSDLAFISLGTEGVEDVSKWTVEVRDAQARRVRRFSRQGAAPGLIEWDGRGEDGRPLPAGEYTVVGRVWGRQFQALSSAARLTVDTVAPQLDVRLSTTVFSPGDPLAGSAAFSLKAADRYPLSHWTLEVAVPGQPALKVLAASGPFTGGEASYVWNGFSESARGTAPNGTYEARLTARDAAGNASTPSVLSLEVRSRPEIALAEAMAYLKVAAVRRGHKISLPAERLFSGPEGAQLTEAAAPIVSRLLRLMEAYPERRIVLNGYDGARGPAGRRTELSSARAWALYSALVKGGVSVLRLEVHGRGGAAGDPSRIEVLLLDKTAGKTKKP